jgi:hypothetical protein
MLTAVLAVLAVRGTQTARAATRTNLRSVPTFGRCPDAQTMKAALKTATPEEDGFIQHVVDLVDGGKLPQKVVLTTFLWARKKPRRQFQYFKYGLTIRARWLGINL